jgi:hypothetical protein
MVGFHNKPPIPFILSRSMVFLDRHAVVILNIVIDPENTAPLSVSIYNR